MTDDRVWNGCKIEINIVLHLVPGVTQLDTRKPRSQDRLVWSVSRKSGAFLLIIMLCSSFSMSVSLPGEWWSLGARWLRARNHSTAAYLSLIPYSRILTNFLGRTRKWGNCCHKVSRNTGSHLTTRSCLDCHLAHASVICHNRWASTTLHCSNQIYRTDSNTRLGVY